MGLFSAKPQPYAWLAILVPLLALGGFMLGERAGWEFRKGPQGNFIREEAPPPPRFANEHGARRGGSEAWISGAVVAVGMGMVLGGLIVVLRRMGQPPERTATASQAPAISDERLQKRLNELEPTDSAAPTVRLT